MDSPSSAVQAAEALEERHALMPIRDGERGLNREEFAAGKINRIRKRNSRDSSKSLRNIGCSRAPLERMQRLHEMLSANRFPNCRNMAAEFEVSTKTVQRDLNFMRDRLRLPIEYDNTFFGFRYTHPVDHPPITLAAVIQETNNAGRAKRFAPSSLSDGIERTAVQEGGIVAIRIRFDAQVAAEVQALTSHPLQETKILPDGSIELKVQLDGVFNLDRWVLSWGAYARVLEPDWLRRRILKIARRILASYRER